MLFVVTQKNKHFPHINGSSRKANFTQVKMRLVERHRKTLLRMGFLSTRQGNHGGNNCIPRWGGGWNTSSSTSAPGSYSYILAPPLGPWHTRERTEWNPGLLASCCPVLAIAGILAVKYQMKMFLFHSLSLRCYVVKVAENTFLKI